MSSREVETVFCEIQKINDVFRLRRVSDNDKLISKSFWQMAPQENKQSGLGS